MNTIGLYRDLEERGARLPFRVSASFIDKTPPFDHAVAAPLDIRDRFSTELVQVDTLKIVGDGSPEGYTAWLIEPYADKPKSRGESPFTAAMGRADRQLTPCGARHPRPRLR